jgi:hypothetical protein
MPRHLKRARHAARNLYLEAVRQGQSGPLSVRMRFVDGDGREHVVEFSPHLLKTLAEQVDQAQTVFERHDPEQLVHPLLRSR